SSARDRAAADGFNAQRRTLGQMGRVLRDVAAARDNVARAREGIAAGPQTPQLRADLQALADTEAADLGGFRTQLRDVSLLARALSLLPSAEQASVLGEAAAMAEGLGAA